MTMTNRGYKITNFEENLDMLFEEFVDRDANFNVKRMDSDLTDIESRMENKILVDGRQSNFNFIRSNVEQNGVNEVKSTTQTIISTINGLDVFIDFAFEPSQTNDVTMIGKFNGEDYKGYIAFIKSTSSLVLGGVGIQIDAKQKILIRINVNRLNNTVSLYYFDKLVRSIGLDSILVDKDKFLLFGTNTPTQAGTYRINKCVYYIRQLTPKEIQHNLSILNNTESINALEVTDTDGTRKKLLLATDSHHVETRDGRTQDKINQVFYSQNGKEFIADATGKIEINNGLEGWVNKAEIQGQTVKNYFDITKKGFFNFSTLDGYKVTMPSFNSQAWFNCGGNLETNKQYYLILNILSISGDGDRLLYIQNDVSGAKTIATKSTGIGLVKTTFTTGSTLSNEIKFTVGKGLVGENGFVFEIIGIFDNNYNIISPLPFGLNSTQAILSNNGQSYPIYEPLIYGKTRTLKAPKGTQNWTEISADEVRDTVTYDYKLESINGDLGSTPNVADYIDRARKVKFVNTKELTFDGTEDWKLSSIVVAGYSSFYISNTGSVNLSNKNCWISSMFASGDYNTEWSTGALKEFIQCMNNTCGARVLSSKASTVDQWKSYLAQQKANGSPVTVRYQLTTPIEIPLTDEELKAYDAFKKLILLPFAEDKVTLNDDGSGTWNKAYETVKLTTSTVFSKGRSGGSTVGFYLTSADCVRDSVYCDKLPTATYSEYLADTITKSCIVSNAQSLVVVVLKTELETEDSAGLIKWLTLKGDITCIRKLTTSTVTTLDKSIMPTILTNKINSLFADSPVAPSSFTATLPTSDNIAKEFTLTTMNLWTGAAKANLLKNGDAELILNVAVPTTYNTHITTLLESCRPKTNKTMLGMNGSTPVAISILATGEVKCMTQITGSIELSATYKLN